MALAVYFHAILKHVAPHNTTIFNGQNQYLMHLKPVLTLVVGTSTNFVKHKQTTALGPQTYGEHPFKRCNIGKYVTPLHPIPKKFKTLFITLFITY